MRDLSPTRKIPWFYERWVLLLSLALIGFGLLMVASASLVISDRNYGYPFHFFFHQLFYVVAGLISAWLVTRVPLKFWQDISRYILLATLFLLVLVLVPHIGKSVNGSRRWLNFGIIALQVSEIVKLAFVIYLADYLVRFQLQISQQFFGLVKPLAVLSLLSLLLLLEPDFGAVLVLTLTTFILLFLANVRLSPLIVLALLAAAMLTVLAIASPYRLHRLTGFLHPWQNPYGSGYQLTQSLIAFGRGGFLGVGLGNSVQKLFYLPEAHTDFVFAVLGEELGLVGEILLLGLFILLVFHTVKIAWHALRSQNLFAAYLGFGLGSLFALQVVINIGVNTGLLPTKGLTLPFISYGGSSMLINCVMVGLILRIAYETKILSGDAPKIKIISNARRRKRG